MSSKLQDCKVLILGGSGFIGHHLAKALLDEKAIVTVYDRTPTHLTNVKFVLADFTDKQQLMKAVEGQDIVFHLISTTIPSTSNDNPKYDVESNLLPTVSLLEACVSSKVKKVIFASSGGTVYGIPDSVPILETHRTDPICSYGIVKIAIEKYLHLFKLLHGLDYTILRISNPYGPGQLPGKGQGVIGEFIHRITNNDEILLFGDGSIVRDFIYITDVVEAMIQAMNREVTGIYNIGSGLGLSITSLIELIGAIVGREVRINYESKRSFDVPSNLLCIDKARADLDWKPTTSIENGIKKILDSSY